VLGLPNLEYLREHVHGIKGAFILKGEEVIDFDGEFKNEVKYISTSISYLIKAVSDSRGDMTRLSIMATDRLYVYIRDSYILNVMAAQNINVPLLNFVANRILLDLSVPKEKMRESVQLEGELPPEKQIPYLYRSRDDVLPNVEPYARQVLEFVDGNRNIREIIEESHLPAEQVWDVILAHRRSSEIHFKK
jgi:hypothetical protein